MKKIIPLWLIFVFSFNLAAYAQTSIKAEVDKKSITTDETLTYKVTVTSSDKKLPQAQIPKFAGFHVLSQASSSNISFTPLPVKPRALERGAGFTNKGIQTTLVYVFILAPTDIGKLEIAPSVIKVKNKTYSTDSFEIEVSKGRSLPKTKPEQSPPAPDEPQSKEPQVYL